MRRLIPMPRCSAFATFLLTCLSTIALAQTGPYCNAGLHPDGYVDFSMLPAPPAAPSSAPIVLTAPVQGVPGLNVQITIPGGSYYVFDGQLILNGAQTADDQLLQLQFNKPVTGVGLRATIGPTVPISRCRSTMGRTHRDHTGSRILRPTTFRAISPIQRPWTRCR